MTNVELILMFLIDFILIVLSPYIISFSLVYGIRGVLKRHAKRNNRTGNG